MPTCNGHEVEVGCYAEGHRGWYAGQRVIEEAQGLGWELDAEGQAAVDAYYGNESTDEMLVDLVEIVSGQGGIVDEAEEWLNEHTPMECLQCSEPMEWVDLGPIIYRAVHKATGKMYCDLPSKPMGKPQSYIWHWHDGEFFLSPICEDEENCTDDTCAHWD